jgi:hypothetical protein
MRYAVYNTSTGEILRVLTIPESMIGLNVGSGESHMEAEADTDGNLHRVVGGVIVDRPAFAFSTAPVAITTAETLHVEDIPDGTVLTYPGGALTIDDGFIDWDAEVPGHYVFTFRLFPYIEAVIHATVTEP